MTVSDFAVLLQASVQTNPPEVRLSWKSDPAALEYQVYRKTVEAVSWETVTSLPGTTTGWVDTNTTRGAAHEYWVNKRGANHFGDGYIVAGAELPLVETRGSIILLVDASHAPHLLLELRRLESDLIGDGWIPIRRNVARMSVDPASEDPALRPIRRNEIRALKDLIKNEYVSHPLNLKSVFMIGRVPVVYSGAFAPDDHANHTGAWPADAYFGDMGEDWEDTLANSAFSLEKRNWNFPNDGKPDPSIFPRRIELHVGRVDLSNLPTFSKGEGELLRQYLQKDHAFRFGLVRAQPRGLIDDHFGTSTGEPLAANAWRNFAPLFGASNTFAADWQSARLDQTYLWSYGCGAGSFTGISGVTATSSLATSDPGTVFNMFFGSYFGDWDSKNNVLRAVLATPTLTLAAVWAGRPFWQFHHMALGECIGHSTRLTQNNRYTYDPNVSAQGVHVALMGDPTLRMHPVGPPSGLAVATNLAGGVVINWHPSSDTILGYHVYRAATANGPFTRLTTNLVAGTNYTDPRVCTDVYMVRAVKLEVSASGSYFNASQGIFQSLDGSAGAPWIALYEPTNNAVFGSKPSIQLSASLFDPANAVTNVSFYAGETKIGDSAGPNYSVLWTNAPGGTYSLVARSWSSLGQHANSIPIQVRVDHGGTPRLSISVLDGTAKLITGDDFSNRVYELQFAPNLRGTIWQTIGTVTGQASGGFRYLDTNTSYQGLYRTLKQ